MTIKTTAADLLQMSQQCHSFSDEATGLLNGFDAQITTLLSGALQSPEIVRRLEEVRHQIADCKTTLNGSMQFVGDAFRQSADQYAATNDEASSLVTNLQASDGGSSYDYSSMR